MTSARRILETIAEKQQLPLQINSKYLRRLQFDRMKQLQKSPQQQRFGNDRSESQPSKPSNEKSVSPKPATQKVVQKEARSRSVAPEQQTPGPGAYNVELPALRGKTIAPRFPEPKLKDMSPGPCDYPWSEITHRVTPRMSGGPPRGLCSFQQAKEEGLQQEKAAPKTSPITNKEKSRKRHPLATTPQPKFPAQQEATQLKETSPQTPKRRHETIGERFPVATAIETKTPAPRDVRKSLRYLGKLSFDPPGSAVVEAESLPMGESQAAERLRQRIKKVQRAVIKAQNKPFSQMDAYTQRLSLTSEDAPYRVFQLENNPLELHFTIVGGDKFDGLLHGAVHLKEAYPRNAPQIEMTFPETCRQPTFNGTLLHCWWPCAGLGILLDELVEKIEKIAPAAAKLEVMEGARTFTCSECGASHEELYPILPGLRVAWQNKVAAELHEQLLVDHCHK